mmetsp:Transcript_10252/g.18697  ORF Transcript_10252/g.18697 Transcript_10252/m.18697 type:complete len:245 (+) Transcript_10252:1609-2343(+)
MSFSDDLDDQPRGSLKNLSRNLEDVSTVAVLWIVRVFCVGVWDFHTPVNRFLLDTILEFIMLSIGTAWQSTVGCPRKALRHNFLQDTTVCVQFECLRRIAGRILSGCWQLCVSVTLSNDDDRDQGHPDQGAQDGGYQRTRAHSTLGDGHCGGGCRGRIEIKSRPVSRNVTLDELTMRSLVIRRTIAAPLRRRSTCQDACSLIGTKPCGRRFLWQLTVGFRLVFTKETGKVSTRGTAIAIVRSLF